MKYRITTTLLDGTSETRITSSDKTAYAAAQGGRSLVETKTKKEWQRYAPFYPHDRKRSTTMGHFNDQYLDDCDRRTADDELIDRRDGVSSAPTMFTQTAKPTIEFEIKYDRLTKDYQCLVDGRCVGYRATYSAGDSLCRQTIADLIAEGMTYTAAELDAPTECTCLPDNLCAVSDPCPTRAAAAAVAQYLSDSVQPFCFFCINADHNTDHCPKLDNGQADRVCDGLDYPCGRPVAFAIPLHPGHAIDGAPVTATMHLCSDCYTRWQSWQAIDPPDEPNPLGDEEEGDSTPPDRPRCVTCGDDGDCPDCDERADQRRIYPGPNFPKRTLVA